MFATGMLVLLSLMAAPYATYLAKDAELFDRPRSWLLRIDFFAEQLDCYRCTGGAVGVYLSLWSSLFVWLFVSATVGVAMFVPLLLACATVSTLVYPHIAEDDEDDEESGE